MNYYPNKINNVLLVGLGGVGTVYADKISQNKDVNLKILVDTTRLEKYKKAPRLLNNKPYRFEYILPTDEFEPDLIIITTKSNGLNNAIDLIKPFVTKRTLIMSFINGLSSERILAEHFNNEQILHSYIICHTITRNDNNVEHDGITKIVWGDKNNDKIKTDLISDFFSGTGLTNEQSDDIIKALWEKFCFNCCVNQISAITGYTFEQIWNDEECLNQMKNISTEIQAIAQAEGLENIDFVDSSYKNLHKMIPEGKTSMLQDIENKRQPEIELFGQEVLKLAKKHGINIPCNTMIFDKLKSKINYSHLS